MAKKGTSKEIKDYSKVKIAFGETYPQLEPHFYNQRLLNQFRRLLKANNVRTRYHVKQRILDIMDYGVLLCADKDGRFTVYGRYSYRGRMHVSFEANNTLQIIHKMLRFKMISGQTAKRFITWEEKEVKIVQNRMMNKETKKRMEAKNETIRASS